MASISDVKDRERFNHWAETYEHSIEQWLFFDRVHQAVLSRIPAGFTPQNILDIGCGTGRLLRRMHDRWPTATLTGIDLSEKMVAQARKYTQGISIYQASAEHIPIEDAHIDLASSTMSFHHWSDQVLGISEIFRVLRKGGIFILADTNLGHGLPRSRTQVRRLLEASNLSIYSQTSPVPFLTFTVVKKE